MGNPDATANAIKELTKEIKKQNKLLERLTEAVNDTKDLVTKEVISKILRETNPVYDPSQIPSYPVNPILNPPYTFTCDNTSSANPPYYGAKVDTTGYGGIGAEWTNKDSLEALK